MRSLAHSFWHRVGLHEMLWKPTVILWRHRSCISKLGVPCEVNLEIIRGPRIEFQAVSKSTQRLFDKNQSGPKDIVWNTYAM